MKHIQPWGKKQNRSVSLYAHQREAFDKLGGSKWLQKQIDAEIKKQFREAAKAFNKHGY